LHIFWLVALGIIAFLWIVLTVDLGLGVLAIPSLKDFGPLHDSACPRVSILFAARDEAEKLPGAIETMLALDYPNYEVIAVDDRSEDATGTILEAAARTSARLKPLRVNSLPSGWLGKPHALQQAYERSSGEWIVLTDADVHFAPDLLRRAIATAKAKNWEHMTLLCSVHLSTAGEKVAMMFFGMAFLMGLRPWGANDPKSSAYIGVGAFQLIRRSAYEKMGTHRRLAMEVIDDMKIGKLVKEAGLRSGIARAGDAVSIEWHAGVANIVQGTTKNFFASTGFRIWMAAAQILAVLIMFVFPVAALPFARGWALVFALIAVALPVIVESGVAVEVKVSPVYALTFPVGALIMCWMLMRSTIVTLWQGGVTWRGTFYPIEELKRGMV
jgi:glycosyltransferase involved in cell wall biosynthesis